MADLVMKQVVAVIDHRTTTVCLHAAGQTRPLDEPFDTLLGEQDDTPFHRHCRSFVAPWMPGFVNDLRRAANAELLTRPKKMRRIGPGGETGPLPPRAPDSPPLPSGTSALEGRTLAQIVDDLPVDEPLEAVPAQAVKAFVEAHPTRFEMTSNGGGISETYWVKDLQTGDRYVLKAGQYHNESIAEVIGTRLQDEIGFRSEVLVSSGMGSGNGWVLLKHAEDIAEHRAAGYKVVGTSGSHGTQAKLGPRLEDPSEAVRKLLVDFTIDEADAKGGNMLLLSKDGGKTVRLAPIDRSLSQMGWREAVEPGKTSVVTGDWSLAGRLKVADLKSYMKTRGSPKGVLELVQSLADDAAGRQMIVEAYDDALATLKRIDLDDLTRGLPADLVAENKTLIAHRIDLLEKKRDTILAQMGVKDAARKVDVPPPTLSADAAKGRSFINATAEVPMGSRTVTLPRFSGPSAEHTYDEMVRQFPEQMREIEEVFGRLYEAYPGAMGQLNGVKIGNTIGRSSLAEYGAGYREIVVDWQKLARMGALQAEFDNWVSVGWMSKAAPGTKVLHYTVEHEVGHHLDGLLKVLGDGKNDPWPTMWRKIGLEMRAAGLDVKSGTKARLPEHVAAYGKQHVSTYAGESPGEFIAEAFAEYRTAVNPGPVARIVGEAFEEAFGTGRKPVPAAALRSPSATELDDAIARKAREAEAKTAKEIAARETATAARTAKEAAEEAEAKARRAAKAVAKKKAADADPDMAMGTGTGMPYDLKPVPFDQALRKALDEDWGDVHGHLLSKQQSARMLSDLKAKYPTVWAEMKGWVPELKTHLAREGQRVVHAVPASRIEALLKAKRWRSAFEVKSGIGGGGKKYKQARQFYEDVLLGLPETVDKKARPIYGYVATGEQIGEQATNYGSFHAVLREEALTRTTVTVGDSLNGWQQARTLEQWQQMTPDEVLQEIGPAGVLWDAEDYASGVKELAESFYAKKRLLPHDYVEAQVHGGVQVADVDYWVVNRSEVVKETESLAKTVQSYRSGEMGRGLSGRELDSVVKSYTQDAEEKAREVETIDKMVVVLREAGFRVDVR